MQTQTAEVETWWFHLIAATVIGSNTVTIVLEADSEVGMSACGFSVVSVVILVRIHGQRW